jgi:DNA-binding CsgD family transcriptional regulator
LTASALPPADPIEEVHSGRRPHSAGLQRAAGYSAAAAPSAHPGGRCRVTRRPRPPGPTSTGRTIAHSSPDPGAFRDRNAQAVVTQRRCRKRGILIDLHRHVSAGPDELRPVVPRAAPPPAAAAFAARLQRSARRERECLAQVVAGRHNRQIAADLGISPRAVEVCKARLMDKLDARRVADRVRLALTTRARRPAVAASVATDCCRRTGDRRES